MVNQEKDKLWRALCANRDRLQWIADEEARSAMLRTDGADGRYDPERQKLIDQAEEILNKLERLYKTPNC